MIYLIYLLIGIGIVAALFGFFSARMGHNEDIVQPSKSSCATCDGTDNRCEQTCMLEAAVKEIVYFDDEELDRFQGKAADAYTNSEIKEFQEILYTMKQEEVKEWSRSLILRGINLPDELKDEVMMLISNS